MTATSVTYPIVPSVDTKVSDSSNVNTSSGSDNNTSNNTTTIIHDVKQAKQYCCPGCQQFFGTAHHLSCHARRCVEAKTKGLVCGYKDCKLVFNDVEERRKHKRRHRDRKEKVRKQCPHGCLAWFSRPQALKRHNEHYHPKNHATDVKVETSSIPTPLPQPPSPPTPIRTPTICPHCQKTLDHTRNLARHIKEVHHKYKNPSIYPCQTCGRKFTTRYNCNRHMNICTDKGTNVVEDNTTTGSSSGSGLNNTPSAILTLSLVHDNRIDNHS